MSVRSLVERFSALGDRPAMIWRGATYSFAHLFARTTAWGEALADRGLAAGTVVALHADYSPESIALLLALLERKAVVALVSDGLATEKADLYGVAQVEQEAVVGPADDVRFAAVGHVVHHPLLASLRARGTGGLVLFSSGSTGRAKAVVHDAARLLAKYNTPRRAKVTIPFMLFDHIGGLNTVLHTLSSGGTAVVAPDRAPNTIGRLIEDHRVQVLPASPTFLNLLLLSGQVERRDFSSLETIAYGAERMAEPTLARLRAALPKVVFAQSYGLSEVGIVHTRSESSDSLWFEIGGHATRVRNGLLEIKADTAMLGYLNEADPFTDDGWLKTNDRVEVRGRFFRILGRATDLIIVGGEKVYPAEVEDHLLRLPGVLDAVVTGEPNAVTGCAVHAQVRLSTGESRRAFRTRMRAALVGRLAPFKIPQRVEVLDTPVKLTTRQKRAQ